MYSIPLKGYTIFNQPFTVDVFTFFYFSKYCYYQHPFLHIFFEWWMNVTYFIFSWPFQGESPWSGITWHTCKIHCQNIFQKDWLNLHSHWLCKRIFISTFPSVPGHFNYLYLSDTQKGIYYNNLHFWLPVYSNSFIIIISALFKFIVHCQFVSWLNFLLESLIFFWVIKCHLFMNSLFTHPINVFSICFVSSTVLGVEDIAVSKRDMVAALLNFQFSGYRQLNKE